MALPTVRYYYNRGSAKVGDDIQTFNVRSELEAGLVVG